MAKVRPLDSPTAARGTLVHRMGLRADRLRQLATKFGGRPRRVFLVWADFSGATAGEGDEVIRERRELLPTPVVADLTTAMRRPMSVGFVADGTVRVSEISAWQYTEANLRGIRIPAEYPQQTACEARTQTPPATDALVTDRLGPIDPGVFFYEIVEDGRGDDPPIRRRYKLGASPWRNATSTQWSIILEPMSADLNRAGEPVPNSNDVLDVVD